MRYPEQVLSQRLLNTSPTGGEPAENMFSHPSTCHKLLCPLALTYEELLSRPAGPRGPEPHTLVVPAHS